MRGRQVDRHAPFGVPGLVRGWSERTPEEVALLDVDGATTYRELELASDVVAARLREAGARPGEPVAVLVPRGRVAVVTMLGALKAGAPYVPLSVDDPAARRGRVLTTAGCEVALVVDATAGMLGEGVTPDETAPRLVDVSDVLDVAERDPVGRVAREPAPLRSFGEDHPAYVLFTSGSTGEPKGVVVPSLALCNRLLWMCEEYGFGPGDRILQKTPFTFDVSGWELWAPLCAGAVEVLMPPDTHRDPGEVVEWITRHGVTVCHFVPSMLREFLAWPTVRACATLRAVMSSGEALPRSLVDRFHATLTADLHNLYGPTEATIDVTAWTCPRPGGPEGSVLIGTPITNTTVVVVDDDLQPVPPGEPGQIAVGGMALATGYLGRPDLTAAAFVTAPAWAGVDRFYLTGDLGRELPDGIEYLGRTDDQLKIRGHRLEPGEVEDALRSCEGVDDAVALAVQEEGDTRLVACLVLAGDVPAGPAGPELTARLRRELRAVLPEAFVPTSYHVVDAFPLTTSGKCDRKRLAEVVATAGPTRSDVPVGGTLRDLWTTVVGRPPAGDGFLSSGGHSLAAARLAGAVLERWGVRVPLQLLLRDDATFEQLADLVERRRGAPGAVSAPVRRAATDGRAPTGPEQRRLWLWARTFPGNPAYNVVGAVEVDGHLDPDLLRTAVGAVVRRHAALRTVFTTDGEDQVLVPPRDVPLTSATPQGTWDDALDALVASVGATPFRPDEPTRVAVGLLRSVTGPPRSAVVLALDHLVADQRSLDVVWRDLAGACTTGLLDASTGDLLSSVSPEPRRRDEDLRYWRETLDGAPPRITLPFTAPRPALPTFAGADTILEIEADQARRLEQDCLRRRVTPATLALVAYARTLIAWSGQDDVVVGVPMSGREREDELDAVGFYVRTLPVRITAEPGTTTVDLLQPVADAVLEAADHAAVTFDEIVAHLRVPRSIDANPVFQVWFNDLTRAEPPRTVAGHDARPLLVRARSSLFDVGLYLHRSATGGLVLQLVHATDLWTAEVAAELVRQCRDRMLEVLTPESGPATRPEALIRVLHAAEPDVPPTARTCADLVDAVTAVATQEPRRVALVHAGTVVDYGELLERVRRVSAMVRAHVPRGEVVVVQAAATPTLAVAVLGCWHAGNPPLLVPADAPEAWREQVRAALPTAAPLRIDDDVLDDVRPTDEPAARFAVDAVGHALTTSGTSGRPVVVLLPADALPDSFDHHVDALGLDARERFCLTAPAAHDPVLRDLVLPLTLGASVHVPTLEQAADPHALVRYLRDTGATVLHTTPSRARLLHGTGARVDSLRVVALHGERVTTREVATTHLLAPSAVVVNVYGTTETPQASGMSDALRSDRPAQPPYRTDPDPGVPVHAVPHRELVVVTSAGERARVGEVGEICVVGTGLALGYLGDERTPPRPGDRPRVRAYLTGDLGRYDLTGGVDVLGRVDRQVQVHGYRVEPAALERAVGEVRGVRSCVADARDDELVLWFCGDSHVTETDVLHHVRQVLPPSSWPARAVRVPELPLTRNGKVDVALLWARPDVVADKDAVATAPRDDGVPLVGLVLEHLRAVTGDVIAPSPYTRFFDAGLTSLDLVRLHARLVRVPGMSGLTVADLFLTGTPAALADHVAELTGPRPGGRGPRRVRDGHRTTATELSLRRSARGAMVRNRGAGTTGGRDG